MGEWLMENGERTSVYGEFAYDTDNDAWVELGSTDGSTPVWWRGHYSGGSEGSYRKSRPLTEEQRSELERLKGVVASCDVKLDAQRQSLKNAEKAAGGPATPSSGVLYGIAYAVTVILVIGWIMAGKNAPTMSLGETIATTSLAAWIYMAVVFAIMAIPVYGILAYIRNRHEASLARTVQLIRTQVEALEAERKDAVEAANVIAPGYVR